MADVYTTTATSGWDTAAYNALAYFALRPHLIFDQLVEVKPTAQTHVGATVGFTLVADLAIRTTPLNETLPDVDAVALSDSSVVVTLVEYGNAVLTSAKIRLTSYVEVDPIVANVVGYNAGVSMDEVAAQVAVGGTNVLYGSAGATLPTSRTTIQLEDSIAGKDIRQAVAKLRGLNSMPFGDAYAAVIHPDISYDLRGGSGTSQWRDVHSYSAPEGIMNGEVGMFEGARFLENPRTPKFVDASNGAGAGGTIDVYTTLLLGQQAIAKAFAMREGYGPNPQVVLGPVVDKLRRFIPVGWRHFTGYSIFRQESLYRIEACSTIGVN